MKVRLSHNIELYLGAINEETKEEFSYEHLMRQIAYFQDDRNIVIPVCVSSVEYMSGSDYRERGWKVSTINYPRLDVSTRDMDKFMIDLAIVLAAALKQNRITVVGPKKTVMIGE